VKHKTARVYGSLVTYILAAVVFMPRVSEGKDPESTNEPAMKVSESNPGPRPTTYEGAGQPPKVGVAEETVVGEMWGDHSYWIPFFEVLAFEALLNGYDRTFLDEEIYGSTWNSFGRNFRTAPVLDGDTFQINQLYHPYQGAMYFGFA
jgi:hypothetical protein